MNKKAKRKLQRIESTIRNDDFNEAELLSFKVSYKKRINKHSNEGVDDTTLLTVISHLSNDAFSVIAMYFYLLIFFIMAFLFVGSAEGSAFFFGATIAMAVLHVILFVNKNRIKYFTFFKLVKLYIRGLF